MLELLVYLKLFGGFVYLLLGGDLLVRGSLGLARQSSISPMVIGLTVVAMGTSAPELMVSSYSAVSGHPGIAVGNVVGSNIANVLLVLGVPVLIYPILCNQKGLIKQTSLMIGVTLMFIAMCLMGPLGMYHGFLLLFVLCVFLVLTMKGASIVPGLEEDVDEELNRVLGVPSVSWKIGLYVFLGVVTLPLGANLVVEGAAGIARNWGVSEVIIGLSLIAIGTSLPELSTTVLAAIHKSSDVAIGNVVGSCLFNMLAIMGVTTLLAEVPVSENIINWDLWIMLLCGMVVWGFALAKAAIGKISGIIFLCLYAAYLWSLY